MVNQSDKEGREAELEQRREDWEEEQRYLDSESAKAIADAEELDDQMQGDKNEPKPDESRLLTEPDEVQVKLSTDDLEPDELDVAYRRGYEEGTINQDIKTASIKDAECQARVERMLEEKEKA